MPQRLDAALVSMGLVPSREKAKAVIMSGQVYVNSQKADKPGHPVREDEQIELRGPQLRYVSRGGLKLEKALQSFQLSVEGLSCMDVGASTGGFTDCMLQNGAARVVAVDVGYGQLAWSLRNDSRVLNLERTNIRKLSPEAIGQPVEFATVDVSFISLGLVLPVLEQLLQPQAKVVCLVKPQFEAGRELVGKKGVVKDPATHCLVLEKVLGFAAQTGFVPLGLDFSPVKGPEGNIEYLLLLQKGGQGCDITSEIVAGLVEASHQALA